MKATKSKTDTLKLMRQVNSAMRLAVDLMNETTHGEAVQRDGVTRYESRLLTPAERAANADLSVRWLYAAQSRLHTAIEAAEQRKAKLEAQARQS